MPRYRADFIVVTDDRPAVVGTIAFDADTVQHAIDEAHRTLPPDRTDVTSIDLFVGEDKVQTVGAGPDAFRT